MTDTLITLTPITKRDCHAHKFFLRRTSLFWLERQEESLIHMLTKILEKNNQNVFCASRQLREMLVEYVFTKETNRFPSIFTDLNVQEKCIRNF
jgi:hypothetical protein